MCNWLVIIFGGQAMSQLRADSNALAGFSGNLAAHAAELESRVIDIQARAVQVFGSSWSGTAADEVRQSFDGWMTSARSVWEALNGLSSFVNVSAESYEISEQTLSRAAETASGIVFTPPTIIGSPNPDPRMRNQVQ